jgi:Na+/H+ antiporter NhaC
MDWGAILTNQGVLTLLAPLVAISAALATKKVVPSLFAGSAVGALVASDWRPIDAIHALASYVANALGFVAADEGVAVADLSAPGQAAHGVLSALIIRDEAIIWVFESDHLIISAFSLLVAATVGVMTAAGGTRALVQSLSRVAKGPRGAMVTTWLAGMVVFFDDYANCLVVGNAMGPLCDRFQVSRAKLAYIVDSTAAPIASLALVSTWVGYEVGLLDEALKAAGSTDVSAFSVFLYALPYRFYSIFTIFFVGAIALSGRDFGPMLVEEEKARNRPPVAVDGMRARRRASLWLAALPVFTLVGLTFALMIWTGRANLGEAVQEARLFEILGEADAYWSMFMGALVSYVLAAILALGFGALRMGGIALSSWNSARAVLEALLILYLAWTLGSAIGDTNAAEFLSKLLSGTLPPVALPAVTFLLAAATAFATGTSFGTMSILIPLTVPLALLMTGGELNHILYGSTAAVLAGACLGDHASPISDTTVLSALGSNVDIVTHVRTQLPYAVAAGLVSMVVGYIPAGFGVTPWILLPAGGAMSVLVVLLLGRQPTITGQVAAS